MDSVEHFSQTYAEARARFVDAARDAGAVLTHHPHPLTGPQGELLATEVARLGDPEARRLLWVGSGTHGIEGYCGSGCQTALLRSGRLAELPPGVGVLLVHAHNPHGFAWGRRVTEDNVDLNRNFVTFEARPAAPAYAEVHPHLVPADWTGPARTVAEAALADYAERHGALALQAAITGGQWSHPDGLFYGGQGPTWSHRTLKRVLAEHAADAERLTLIDIHSGLGPTGHGEIIFPGPPGPEFEAARRAFGPTVTCPAAGTSTSAVVQGMVFDGFKQAVPRAAHVSVALEFGTVPLPTMIEALRGDHWAHDRGRLDSDLGEALKARIRGAFYVETPAWKRQVSAQCAALVQQAIADLAR